MWRATDGRCLSKGECLYKSRQLNVVDVGNAQWDQLPLATVENFDLYLNICNQIYECKYINIWTKLKNYVKLVLKNKMQKNKYKFFLLYAVVKIWHWRQVID